VDGDVSGQVPAGAGRAGAKGALQELENRLAWIGLAAGVVVAEHGEVTS
jgi:hypothetical protein